MTTTARVRVSLEALHAPQFTGAFQPESWILKATIITSAACYSESKAALAAFDELYIPMAEKLKPIVENEHGGHGRVLQARRHDREREGAEGSG